MKKNYSNPRVKFVLLDTSDIVCASPNSIDFGGTTSNNEASDAKRRPDIWDE